MAQLVITAPFLISNVPAGQLAMVKEPTFLHKSSAGSRAFVVVLHEVQVVPSVQLPQNKPTPHASQTLVLFQ